VTLTDGPAFRFWPPRPLAFARSLGEFGATLMFAGSFPGRTQTMAVAIYDALESGNTTLALTLVLVISAIALAILTARDAPRKIADLYKP